MLRSLTGGWRFNGAPALAADIQVFREATRLWLAQQADDIGGTHLDRPLLQSKLAAEMAAHRLTLIKGLPGAGKTVLLRGLAQRLATEGTGLEPATPGVTGQSIKWEASKGWPRARQMDAIAGIRKMGKRKAAARQAKLG